MFWNIVNVSDCTVSGGDDNWSGAGAGCDGTACTSGSPGKTSSAINQRTRFTLSCTGLDDSSIYEAATVDIAPVFRER